MTMREVLSRLRTGADGQSLIEAAITLPLILLVVFGLVDVGYALLDSHTVTRLSREGSNLVSRNTSLEDAVTAVESMSTGLVDFSTNSKVIFSVIKRGGTIGTPNYDRMILYQRHEYGSLSAGSRIGGGRGSFGGAPDFVASNSDFDTNLQVTGLPPNVITVQGGLVYVTEIFSTHQRITPVHNFGVTVPNSLYSIAYF